MVLSRLEYPLTQEGFEGGGGGGGGAGGEG